MHPPYHDLYSQNRRLEGPFTVNYEYILQPKPMVHIAMLAHLSFGKRTCPIVEPYLVLTTADLVAMVQHSFCHCLDTLLAARPTEIEEKLKNTLAFLFPKELSKAPKNTALPCLVLLIADQGLNVLRLVAAWGGHKNYFGPRQKEGGLSFEKNTHCWHFCIFLLSSKKKLVTTAYQLTHVEPHLPFPTKAWPFAFGLKKASILQKTTRPQTKPHTLGHFLPKPVKNSRRTKTQAMAHWS